MGNLNTKFDFDYPCVWYYRESSPQDDAQILYSVRSACKNLNPSKIIIIGDKPKWFVETKNSIYIESKPLQTLDWRIGWVPWLHMEELVKQNLAIDEFLLFNDDFFVINPVYKWVDYERAPSDYEIKTAKCKPYNIIMLKAHKYTQSKKYFNLHIPMRLRFNYLKTLIGIWKNLPDKNIDFRSMYGNSFLYDYKDLKAIPDVKTFVDSFDETKPFLSISSTGFSGKIYKYLVENFKEQCFCERKIIEKVK